MTNRPGRRNNARKHDARAHQAVHGGQYRDAARAVTRSPNVPSFAHALGITTTDFDPTSAWHVHDHDRELWIPLGHDNNGTVVTTGLPGLILSRGGGGKSTLLQVAAAALCLRYSPQRVNLLLADLDSFGTGTFVSLPIGLPHVLHRWQPPRIERVDEQWVVPGLGPIIAEIDDVLRREHQRRQDILATHGVDNIHAYRQAALPPDAPVLPDLVAIIDAPVGAGAERIFPADWADLAAARAALGMYTLSWAYRGHSVRQLVANVGYMVGLVRGVEGSRHLWVENHRREVLTDLKDGNMYAVGRPHTGRSTVRSRTPAPPPKVFSFPLEDAAIVNALNRIPTT
ncbi:hypothetical protein EB73_07165 [Mycobacterium sp. SWH-M3]|nr:hypothetical protein EB73_07165 [Mycobacterium sp. SWH-M3]